jgi:hypothetical protein
MTRRPPGRIDLDDLAGELTAREESGAPWLFTGVSAIFPTLQLDAPESSIPRDEFLDLVTNALASGTPSWDPY